MATGIIYKYPLNLFGETILKIPGTSQFLSVKLQGDEIVAYFLLDEVATKQAEGTDYRFYVIGTGHSFVLNEGMEMLETVMLNEGRLVLHVFMR